MSSGRNVTLTLTGDQAAYVAALIAMRGLTARPTAPFLIVVTLHSIIVALEQAMGKSQLEALWDKATELTRQGHPDSEPGDPGIENILASFRDDPPVTPPGLDELPNV
jgi:hypothetical protein